ncbi:hypothetical protein K431DRAFT_111645 [Polychaeton citri CBS 116435]|uniref:Uncharacterized protein n=1 Tax=Polychaeton citri CBS 116435 TaxID=1314669 RepID=A0A9P4Q4J9_9PEZI|nr:hypothetical protein K431DRAFT_111645 [Polychaeton citri CBS 116435]
MHFSGLLIGLASVVNGAAVPAAVPLPGMSGRAPVMNGKPSSSPLTLMHLESRDQNLVGIAHIELSAAALGERQERCDWDSYCHRAFQECVKSCDSLKNADW